MYRVCGHFCLPEEGLASNPRRSIGAVLYGQIRLWGGFIAKTIWLHNSSEHSHLFACWTSQATNNIISPAAVGIVLLYYMHANRFGRERKGERGSQILKSRTLTKIYADSFSFMTIELAADFILRKQCSALLRSHFPFLLAALFSDTSITFFPSSSCLSPVIRTGLEQNG